jgi:hypothetical protein
MLVVVLKRFAPRNAIFGDLWQSKLPNNGESLSSVTDINFRSCGALESAACSVEVRKVNR